MIENRKKIYFDFYITFTSFIASIVIVTSIVIVFFALLKNNLTDETRKSFLIWAGIGITEGCGAIVTRNLCIDKKCRKYET